MPWLRPNPLRPSARSLTRAATRSDRTFSLSLSSQPPTAIYHSLSSEPISISPIRTSVHLYSRILPFDPRSYTSPFHQSCRTDKISLYIYFWLYLISRICHPTYTCMCIVYGESIYTPSGHRVHTARAWSALLHPHSRVIVLQPVYVRPGTIGEPHGTVTPRVVLPLFLVSSLSRDPDQPSLILSRSLSLFCHIYIYIFIHVYLCIHIAIKLYLFFSFAVSRDREFARSHRLSRFPALSKINTSQRGLKTCVNMVLHCL